MTIIIGVAGQAGVGKDTVASYLSRAYGFISVSWADALREEVRAAFGLDDYSLMLDRSTKETPRPEFALENCADSEFVELASARVTEESDGDTRGERALMAPLSPRWVLQYWGSEYRRAQNPQYWIERTVERIEAIRASVPYPEQRPQLFVIPDTRFENERRAIVEGTGHATGADYPQWDGNIWHLRRDAVKSTDTHQSAQPLPLHDGERELYNNDTLEALYRGIDLLLSTSAKFVRCEPMAPMEDPDITTPNAELALA